MKNCYCKNVLQRTLFYFLILFSLGIYSQGETIKGKISASDGLGLPGANVVQKGTSNGVVADMDGDYSITLNSNGQNILIFSYIGFKTIEVRISDSSFINVTLEEDAQGLDEVVVIGYGSQKKSDITGSVSIVESKDFDKAVYNNVDQILQGRAAGVVVSSSSGEPGARSTIRIRGNNSISGNNSPLYVIDGVPISGVPDFNPSDINSIEVLKDASATAIYGSRGANGVILISTKRGEKGVAKIDLNFETTLSSVINRVDMLEGQDYATYRNESNIGLGNPIPFPNPEQYVGQGYNWQDEIFVTGYRQNMGLNISGGSDSVRYFVAGNYLQENGIILDSKYGRGSVKTNLDIDAFDDKLKFNIGLTAYQIQKHNAISATRGFPNQLGPVTNALLSEPLVPSLDYSGLTAEGFQFYNPYLEVTEKEDRSFNNDILLNGQATWQISEPLSFIFNGGINSIQDIREIFYPSTVGPGINSLGSAQSNTNRGLDFVVSSYFKYNKIFNKTHSIDATIGVEYSEFNRYSTNTNVSNFELEILGLDNLGIGTSLNAINSSRSLSVLQSGFVRLNYGYRDKYLLTFTGRADGSSRFAENEKWAYFPSGAIVWVVSNENFLEDNNTINKLRLKASYGETGSQSISPYQSLARYGTVQYPLGNSPSLGYAPISVENPNLRWETTAQLDFGIELGLFQNRLDLSLGYFKKTTKDLLQPINIPSQSGFGTALINFGSIENKGFELELNSLIVNSPDFSWNTGVNFTTFKNKVLELGGNEEIFGPSIGANFGGSGHIYRPGEEFGQFYGLKAIGLIQEDDFDSQGNPLFAIRNNDTQLGHWMYEDINNDGIINPDDRTIIGNPNPDYIFGWNNDFTYKSLTLNVFIQGSMGNDIYNALGTVIRSGFQDNQSYKNQSADWYQNRWTPSNPTNNIQYPSLNNPSPPVANFMVEDGSYIRLKNVSLRYDIPINQFFSGLQVYITGTNLFTITDYTGYDPEVSSFGANSLAPGVDLGVYPMQRSYTLGFNFQF